MAEQRSNKTVIKNADMSVVVVVVVVITSVITVLPVADGRAKEQQGGDQERRHE